MAQRKKGKVTRRGKITKRRKTRSRAAVAAKGKTRKRGSAKAMPHKTSARIETKRVISRLTQAKTAAPRQKPKQLPIEVVKVEQIDEPAPGVVVVSEYESVQVGPTTVTVVPDEAK